MDQPSSGRRIPWGLIITCLFLSALVFGVYRIQKTAPWGGVLYVMLATLWVYMTGRWLLGSVWAVALALMLALHPLYQHWGLADSGPLEGEALKLLALVGILRAWQLIFRSANNAVRLVPVGVLLAVAISLSWLAANVPGWGLAANLLVMLGLLLALVLIILRRRGPDEEYQLLGSTFLSQDRRPPAVHVTLAALLVVTVPILGFGLTLAFSHAAVWLDSQGFSLHLLVRRQLLDPASLTHMLENAVQLPGPGSGFPGLANAESQQWAWPWLWPNLGPGPWFAYGVLFALVLLGLFRAGWRGWVQWTRREPPLAWVLALYALAVGISCWLDPEHARASLNLPLATPTLILPVFGIADLITALGERLRLAPPEDGPAPIIQE